MSINNAECINHWVTAPLTKCHLKEFQTGLKGEKISNINVLVMDYFKIHRMEKRWWRYILPQSLVNLTQQIEQIRDNVFEKFLHVPYTLFMFGLKILELFVFFFFQRLFRASCAKVRFMGKSTSRHLFFLRWSVLAIVSTKYWHVKECICRKYLTLFLSVGTKNKSLP